MKCFTKDKFCYIAIPKNAQTTYSSVFKDAGWTEHQDILTIEPTLINENYTIFSHIQYPRIRHTKGLAQYLFIHNLTSLLDYDANIQKLLVSAVFDVHTYSIHHLLSESIIKKTQFLVMDGDISCNEITNAYFKYNNIPIEVQSDFKMHCSDESMQKLQEKIEELKTKYFEEYNQLEFNFLWKDHLIYKNELLKSWEYFKIWISR